MSRLYTLLLKLPTDLEDCNVFEKSMFKTWTQKQYSQVFQIAEFFLTKNKRWKLPLQFQPRPSENSQKRTLGSSSLISFSSPESALKFHKRFEKKPEDRSYFRQNWVFLLLPMLKHRQNLGNNVFDKENHLLFYLTSHSKKTHYGSFTVLLHNFPQKKILKGHFTVLHHIFPTKWEGTFYDSSWTKIQSERQVNLPQYKTHLLQFAQTTKFLG